jgi:hypothetical protein
MDPKDIIEIGIGSLGKIKIIRALAEENKLATVYLLHKRTHLKREDIKSNLKDLISIGWVSQSKYANLVYSINRDDPLVMRFVACLKDMGYVGQP